MTLRNRAQRAPSSASLEGVCELTGRSILIVCSDREYLTQGQEVLDMAQTLSQLGATPVIAGPLGAYHGDLGDFHCVPLNLPLDHSGFLMDQRHRRAINRFVTRTGVDLVHAIGSRAAVLGARIAQARQVPFASTLTQPLSTHKMREAESLVAAQRVFVANAQFTEELVDMAPQCEDRAQLTPQGVDLDVYSPAALRSADLIDFTQWFNIPHHKPILVVKCSEAGEDIQSLFFDALADLAPLEFMPFLEVPKGASKLRDRLERAIMRLRLGAQVRLIERMDDPRLLYQVAEAVMVDSFPQMGFSLPVAEAGALGKPALVPLIDGVRAQVQHDVNGWIFTTQGHHTLKASIAKALTLSPERRRTMQAAAQLHVRKHYDAKTTRQHMIAAYEALIAANQPFPGVADMVDFDGDPLELAQTDVRRMGLISQERDARPYVSMRESNPSIRHAFSDRDREQQDRGRSRNTPRRRGEARPHQQTVPRYASAAHDPSGAAPSPQGLDIVPPPQGTFSLLELAKKPGAPALVNPPVNPPPEAHQPLKREDAVDLSGPLGQALRNKGKH